MKHTMLTGCIRHATCERKVSVLGIKQILSYSVIVDGNQIHCIYYTNEKNNPAVNQNKIGKQRAIRMLGSFSTDENGLWRMQSLALLLSLRKNEKNVF